MVSRSHFVPILLLVLACQPSAPRSAPVGERSATALATGITRADSGSGANTPRTQPFRTPQGDVELLYGDPDSIGPFVMRIRELPGTVVPPHSHPADEHITVLYGTWYFGFGETFDSTKLRPLPTGSYAYAPAGTTMFGYSPDLAVVQVHGVGPFPIHWRHPAASLRDPEPAHPFRFRLGDQVEAPRGRGVIREGYASGSIVQYEIERKDGSRFLTHEHEVHMP